MKKSLFSFAALVFAGSGFAQEVTSPEITPYGSAQYRLRYRIMAKEDSLERSGSNYFNQFGYMFGMKVKANEKVNLQFQIGNKYITTDTVEFLQNTLAPIVNLAFAKYDNGMFNISVGKIPVFAYGTLDLTTRSLEKNSYAKASHSAWANDQTNSLLGIQIGAPVIKGDVAISAELISSVITDRVQAVAEKPKSNPSALLEVINIPVSAGKLSVTPQVVLLLNKSYNSATENGNHEIGAGLASSFKISDKLSINGKFAWSSFGNEEMKLVDTVYSGILAGLGATAKVGLSNLSCELQFSTNEDTKSAMDSKYSYVFLDLKAGLPMTKNFEFMPRLRYFGTTHPDGHGTKSESEIRPELIFTGKF